MNNPANYLGYKVVLCQVKLVKMADFDDYESAHSYARRRRLDKFTTWVEIIAIDKEEGVVTLDFWRPN